MSQAGSNSGGGQPGSGAIFTINHIDPDGAGNFTLTEGSNITLTPETNGLVIAASSSGVTIAGDSGSISGNSLTIYSDYAGLNAGATVLFINSGTVSTFNVTDSNGSTIIGKSSGNLSGNGIENTIFGGDSYTNGTNSDYNVGLGYGTLFDLSSGSGGNVAIGWTAGAILSSGSTNCYFGYRAGSSATTNDSNDIYIANLGVSGESNCLRIGSGTGISQQQLSKAYIAGINGNTLTGTPLVVTIDSTTDQLGVATFPSGGGYPLPLTVVTGATQALLINNAYASNDATVPVVFTLPSTAAAGSEIEIMGLGAHGWSISQNASQLIYVGSQVSTTGTGGSVASTQANNTIVLKCLVANTTWIAKSYVGNLSVT